MKLAVFGDIHGNAVALRAALADMDRIRVDAKVCLGDIAFRGPQPGECLEMVFGSNVDGVVVGNTDQWLFRGFPEGFSPPEEKLRRLERFRAWALDHIDESWLERLRALPLSHTVKLGAHTLTVVHSSPRSTEDWFDASLADSEMVNIFNGAGACDILVYGHIHTPFVRRINRRWLVNTGSVGNPIDGDHRASYAVFTVDDQGLSIEIRRVTYDVSWVGNAAHAADFPYYDEYTQALRAGQPL